MTTYFQPDPVILVDSTGAPYTAGGGGGGTTDMTATNTKLDTLHTDNAVQATAANQATANTSLSTIATAVQAATPAGTNLVGGVFNGTATQPSVFSTTAAASTNATSVKASAGTLFEVSISNTTSSPVFFKFYNTASAPTVGTDVPILTIPVPGNGCAIEPFGANGKRFTTGIAWALTGGILASDTAAVGAGVQVHGSYV